MSQNSSNKQSVISRIWFVIGLSLWTVSVFLIVQILVGLAASGLMAAGVPLDSVNSAVFNSVAAAIIYIVSLGAVVGVPLWVRHRRTTRSDLGVTRLPSWLDIILAPAALIIYMIISAAVLYIFSALAPQIDLTQAQDIPFSNLSHQYEYVLAFLTLVVLAPLAEELLFRGYLFGKMKKHAPFWLAMIITSVLFGGLHLIAGESLQWNVAADTFALSLVLCTLRQVTGNIWAGVLLHMIKNGIAYYFLFINPSLLHTIGG
ncbi:MAG: type II CAAX endopeptidase family protein [Candidatus Saccharimonadales bacterium]